MHTLLIGIVLAVLLFAGTITVFVIVAYHQYKLHNRNQETPQGSHVCSVFI